MVWQGLGVNYKADQSNWAADAPYLQSIGITGIRPNLPGTYFAWDPSNNQLWRDCAKFFADKGFFVTWGITKGGNLRANNWQFYHDSVISEAMYCQSQGINLGDYEVGNELEIDCRVDCSSLTQTGGTATFVSIGNHGFINGESVTITGATPSGYNGTFTVNISNSTTFTFTVSSGLSSPASGTINAFSLTYSQCRANIRQLAIDLKAAGYLGSVSYGTECGTVAFGHGSDLWSSEGKGSGMDTISMHPYGIVSNRQDYDYMTTANYTNYFSNFYNAFGTNGYISEFNLDGDESRLVRLRPELAITATRNMLTYIKNSGFQRAFIYSYVGFLNQNNDFAMKNVDGSFNPVWDVFVNDNHRTTTISG